MHFLLQPNFVFYPSLTVYLLRAVSNIPGIGGGGAGVGDGGGVERAADRGDVVGRGNDSDERGVGRGEGPHVREARVRGAGREVEIGVRGADGGGGDVAGDRGGGGGGGDGGVGGDRFHGGGLEPLQLLESAEAG